MRWFAGILFIIIVWSLLLAILMSVACSVPKSVSMYPPEPVYSPADDPDANYGSENDLYPGIYFRWSLEMR